MYDIPFQKDLVFWIKLQVSAPGGCLLFQDLQWVSLYWSRTIYGSEFVLIGWLVPSCSFFQKSYAGINSLCQTGINVLDENLSQNDLGKARAFSCPVTSATLSAMENRSTYAWRIGRKWSNCTRLEYIIVYLRVMYRCQWLHGFSTIIESNLWSLPLLLPGTAPRFGAPNPVGLARWERWSQRSSPMVSGWCVGPGAEVHG